MEKTILVGLVNRNQDHIKCQEYLDELEFLSFTAGGTVAQRFTQRIENPNPATLIGKGKMDEISTFVKAMDIQTIIFDDELSPAQEKNISKILKIRITQLTQAKTMVLPLGEYRIFDWMSRYQVGRIAKWSNTLYRTLQKKQPGILFRDVVFSVVKEGGKRWLVLYLHGKIAAEANKLYSR